MNLLRWSCVLSCGIAVSTLLLVEQAGAASFTIVNGQTVITTQTLDTTGDVGTVEQGGTIEVVGGYGISATTNGVTVDNAGSVTGTGLAGIDVLDDSMITNSGTATGGLVGIAAFNGNTITNSGAVTGTIFGISADNDNTITNSGTAMSTVNGSGIVVDDGNTIDNSGLATGPFVGIAAHNDNTITNSGTAEGVSTGGIAAYNGNTITNSGTATGKYGILANDNNSITNSGSATGGVMGINANADNTITNSGTAEGGLVGINVGSGNTITNSGMVDGGAVGIATGVGNWITNSGEVRGSTRGIYVTNGNTITNSGKIVGDRAVDLDGTDNTLTLLRGSTIQGGLALGDSSNTLIIGRGLETALAFTGTPTIDTSGQPFVIADGTLYVVNPTLFSVQDEMTNDLTREVTGAVEGRLASARLTGGGGMSVAMNGMTVTPTADITTAASDNGIWLSGIGSYRDQNSDGNTDGFETALGGAVGGIDGMVADNTRAGIFAGLAFANLNEDKFSQDLDSDNYFGGLYLSHEMGSSFVDLSLTAGWSEFHSDRKIANNMVDGGIEHAKADYSGFLISPSLKLGTDLAMGSGTFTPSIRARYAGLFMDDYNEHGSATDLSVDSRDINIFDVRGELAYRFAARETPDGSLHQTVRLGVDGTFSDADRVDATLAGQALQFNVSDDDLARGFAGYDVAYVTSGSASFNLSTEAGYDTNDAFTLEGHAGVAWAF